MSVETSHLFETLYAFVRVLVFFTLSNRKLFFFLIFFLQRRPFVIRCCQHVVAFTLRRVPFYSRVVGLKVASIKILKCVGF